MVKTIAKYALLVAAILLVSLRLATLKPTPPPHLRPSPTPTPMVSYIGWKEFKNPTYNYMIKHPHDWYFHETGLNPPPPTTILLSNKPEEKKSQPHVSVEIFTDKANGRTLDTYEEIVDLVSQGHIARPLKVSNSPAVLIDHLGDSGKLANMYVERGDYIYRLSWDGTHPDVRYQFKNKSLAIMASFTFLDQL